MWSIIKSWVSTLYEYLSLSLSPVLSLCVKLFLIVTIAEFYLETEVIPSIVNFMHHKFVGNFSIRNVRFSRFVEENDSFFREKNENENERIWISDNQWTITCQRPIQKSCSTRKSQRFYFVRSFKVQNKPKIYEILFKFYLLLMLKMFFGCEQNLMVDNARSVRSPNRMLYQKRKRKKCQRRE